MDEEKKEKRLNVSDDQKKILIVAFVCLVLILVPFVLYLTNVISKGVMSLLFILPVGILIATWIIVKRREAL